MDDTPHIRLDGNLSEGFTAIGPYPDFDSAAEAQTGLGWIKPLTPPTQPLPPIISQLDPCVVLVGNLSDGFTVIGPYPTPGQAAAVNPEVDTWVLGLTPPEKENNE